MFKKITNHFVNVWCGMDVLEFDSKFYYFAYSSCVKDIESAYQRYTKRTESDIPEAIIMPFTLEEARQHQQKYPEQTQFSLVFDCVAKKASKCDCGAEKTKSTHASWCSTLGA